MKGGPPFIISSRKLNPSGHTYRGGSRGGSRGWGKGNGGKGMGERGWGNGDGGTGMGEREERVEGR